MVRKHVFTREDVLEAALAVVAHDGMAALSARRVADELGASTAPVYSNFANMEELAEAVRQAVTDEILRYTGREWTDNPFLNIGVGVLQFVREKPGLYAAVFLHHAGKCEAAPRLMGNLARKMASLPGVSDLPAGERLLLLHQMGIFTHGLAVQLCSGLADEFTFDDMVLFLEDAGAAMTRHTLAGPERSAAQADLIARLLTRNAKDD